MQPSIFLVKKRIMMLFHLLMLEQEPNDNVSSTISVQSNINAQSVDKLADNSKPLVLVPGTDDLSDDEDL
jgi:hypothetical protein